MFARSAFNRGPFASLDASQRVFAAALAASILLHALLLSIHFSFPDAMKRIASAQPLEVVLVNAKSRNRPAKADVLAQANVDGGGNTDDRRIAKTPLPVLNSPERGADLQQATRRVQELEAQQRELLAQVQQANNAVPPKAAAPQAPVEPQPQRSGADLVTRSLAIARMEAQISRNTDEYNKRPRKLNVGVRAAEASVAQYLDEWRRKIERIGSLNYPDEARGKLYGSLQLTVSINPDGTLAGVELDRTSGHKVIDAAAERIVRMSAPYAQLPASVRKDYDILVITRTWSFVRGDRVLTE